MIDEKRHAPWVVRQTDHQAIQDDKIGGKMVFSDATEVNCWAVRRMSPTNWEGCEARRLSLHPPAVL